MTDLKLDVIRFNCEDVIATSTFAILQANGSYNIYNGRLGAYDSTHGGWYVNLGDQIDNVSAEDFGEYSTNLLSWNPDINSLYEIYDGTYTKGTSYVELKGTHFEAGGGGAVSGGPTNPPAIPGFGS